MYRIPAATYRLQFNAEFRFDDARAITSFLAKLGISDLYASPILKARQGSGHGYDVVDPNVLNPELGTDDDLTLLHEELKRHDMGFLLDIVPNHMAASSENAWWTSVLENGPQSRYLHYFDIDWRPVPTTQGETVNKVLLPILGKPYGEAVESQEVQLAFDADGLHFNYYDRRLPLAPHTYKIVLRECVESLPEDGVGIEIRDLVQGDQTITNSRFVKDTLWRIYEQSPAFREALDAALVKFNGVAGQGESFDAIDGLLDGQWYRLAYWRIATHKINYRRFFDVTDLVGVRIENPEVFEARHKKIISLVSEGKVTGLRIDHIDGLHDPVGHMRKLQLRMGDGGAAGGSITTSDGDDASQRSPQNFYVVVEKILAHDETLRTDFAVSGTTGYDFLDSVNALQVDPAGLKQLDDFYREYTGITTSYEDLCYQRKKQVIHELFSGEMRGLGKQLGELSMHDRNARDFVPSDLLVALTEITACMDVYRTYVRDGEITELDRDRIRRAVALARKKTGTELDQRIFDFIERTLLLAPPSYVQHEHDRWAAFVMRWQQFTGRVMAKGVEDTSFYNFNRLVSLNEVGSEPERHDFEPVSQMHAFNARRAEDWPHTLNVTSTHDTKRGEDVRARLNVISEIPDEWANAVREWSSLTADLRHHGLPDPNEELLVYQTIVGMWPLEESEVPGVPDRLRAYLEKAAREAKTHTSWIAPDPEFESRFLAYSDALVKDRRFLDAMRPMQELLAFHGFINALSQAIGRIFSPGVPDLYRGTELWDLNLVDPDNRRKVDYDLRIAMLDELERQTQAYDVKPVVDGWRDGRVKLYTIWRALDARRRHIDALRDGDYQSVAASGEHARSIFSFTRAGRIAVIAPRLTTRVYRDSALRPRSWGDTAVTLEDTWKNIFTGETFSANRLLMRDVLARFPVAVLERV